jgi:hypothetical protein
VRPDGRRFEPRLECQPRWPRLGYLQEPQILVGCCPVGLLDDDRARLTRVESQPAVSPWFTGLPEDVASTIEPRELAIFVRSSEYEDTVGRNREEGPVQK